MRRVSKKTAARNRKWGPIRKQYLLDMGTCAVCGGPPSDVHEILGGSYRHLSFVEPALWMAVCRRCHEEVQSTSVHWQLAFKLLADPHNYDLGKVFAVWDRLPTESDYRDLHMFIVKLVKARGDTLLAG